jgi:hypothetical protein
MGDPELRNDEKVLVRTPGVYVKSIPFEGILTNKRVILVDRAKNLLPPKEIPFATIKEVEAGENAIRDQTLTLTVMAKTGETRQMILTFSRQEGGNRIKERDEWARAIRQNIGATFDNVIRRVIPGTEPASRPAEPQAPPRISVVNTPVQPAEVRTPPAPIRRETEGIHPIKKIIDAGTITPPAPAVREFDASTLGQNVFCSRCGNKVPLDSAFCNRCGSAVVAPAAPASQPITPPAPSPAAEPAPNLTAPILRPIDRDIQTIEPLIERSTEKIPSDPLRSPVPDVPIQQSLSWDDETDEEPAAAPSPVPAPGTDATPTAPPAAKKGFLPRLFSPKARTQEPPAPPAAAPAAVPPVPQPRRSIGFKPDKKMILTLGAILVVIILVAVVALFVYPMVTSGGLAMPSGTTSATPSPTTTSSAVKPSGTFVVVTETPAPSIPPTGVYVHVNYLGGWKGSFGAPSDQVSKTNSGDRIMEVENANGTVTASFEKLDGSAHELLVEIYKDGALLTKGTTTIGHGSVALSVDTVTGVAATPVTSGGGSAAAAATAVPAATTAKSANSTATVPVTTVPGTTATIASTTTPAVTNTSSSP